MSKLENDKFLKKILDYEKFKNLNMNEIEQEKWKNLMIDIYKQDIECKKLKNDKCVNNNFIHLTLERDLNKQIVIKCYECIKKKLRTNYLIRQFSNNLLSLSILDKNNNYETIDQNEQKLNDFYKNSILKNKIIGLYFFGNVGIGKTYKTISYCNDMILKNNRFVSYVFLPELVRQMKENFSNDSSCNKRIIDNCCKADILILDDFGAEYTSTWFYFNVLLIILNYRCETKKPIIIISNFNFLKLRTILMSNLKTINNQKNDYEIQSIMINRLMDRINNLVNKKEITYNCKTRR